ncbi:MAG: circadian clock KaiB family protein [Oscillatoriaceae bacterium SKW80]|nr:circadian clock KaiB family protein [Oscillatoriaceae bacterium SKYG93]MCX8121672.1 circadian clock KaiB family protein [Oscillatoriaceae bacterium SKW80]MDW8453981.1 circadian clock KaiB family protein [Oscillatoriaceae cyanobacterium SKYGB_i_bin93]HIK28776.1 circadian clock KaiB family protein [Oscillatoriaceae cyanobacterium M7585_C2015_266]
MPELSGPDGYVLRLYVGRRTAAKERTLQRLYQLLQEALACPYTLKVIDIFKHPDLAEADRVSVTPTLLKIWPLPVRRIVGELEDVGTILRILTGSENSDLL